MVNYDITKYLRNNTVEFELHPPYHGGKFYQKDLNTWCEIEELLEESWKESGENETNWLRMTGLEDYFQKKLNGRNSRTFGCFLGEARQAIEKLGGKFYNERTIRIKDNSNNNGEGEHISLHLY